MKHGAFKIFVATLLAVTLLCVMAFAQSEAGFLDNEPPPGYQGVYSGSGWYCVGSDMVWSEEYQMFVPVTILYAGPYQTQPSQQFCSQF